MQICVFSQTTNPNQETTFVQNSLALKTKLIFLFAGLFLSIFLFGQERITTEEYIESYKDVAIKKMKEYKIPASITLAQGILESGSGNSKLATKANNHFGIKCHKGWTGKTFTMDDDEKNECFRKYKHASDSYRDHSLFLTQRGRYTFLFEYETTDYKSWAKGLKKAGYATNPKYPELLIRLIEKYDLAQYDTGVKTKKKKSSEEKVETIVVSPLLSNNEVIYTTLEGRDVYENYGIRYVIGKPGDTFYALAEEFDIYSWQLFKYNDRDKDHVVKSGEIVYLEKKNKKADKKYKTHMVKQGETLHYISDLYGIRMNRLVKMNKLEDANKLSVGQKLKLR